jgi:hypothetical protein
MFDKNPRCLAVVAFVVGALIPIVSHGNGYYTSCIASNNSCAQGDMYGGQDSCTSLNKADCQAQGSTGQVCDQGDSAPTCVCYTQWQANPASCTANEPVPCGFVSNMRCVWQPNPNDPSGQTGTCAGAGNVSQDPCNVSPCSGC